MTGNQEYALPLHMERFGQGGSPLVLLHGYGASAFSFLNWIPSLAERHEVWAIDLKGHGSAPAPSDDRYSPHDHAELVRRFIIQKDLKDVTLFGHSMGGGIALLVALGLLGQGRIRSLALICGSAYAQRLPPFVSLARRGRTSRCLLAAIPKRWLVRRVLKPIVYDSSSITETQVEAYAEPLRRSSHRLALIKTALEIVPPDLADFTGRYSEIDVPTLLLWGRHDHVVPLSVGERLAKVLPRGSLVVLEECGHLPAEELPKESLAIVEEFLRDGGVGALSEG